MRPRQGMPMQAAREDSAALDRLTAAQVVHSTNKFGTKPEGEARVTHVSALFHSYLVDFK
ncbi:hypothetical protein ACIGHF_05995 [Stenotrophomonas sp. NPDC077464]|uniref:hypothetical protein n=1 Tax=unclassified Stenotrophomonas TaxID=196198 RepID=UPI0037D57FB1